MKKSKQLLTYRQATSIRLGCEINLDLLFRRDVEWKKFESKWKEFKKFTPFHTKIYKLSDKRLIYDSEQLIPHKKANRPSLLLVLGNPATQSIKNGMFFSFEKDRQEHRFWKGILKPAGVLDLATDTKLPIKKQNELRKRQLLNIEYDTSFRIGLCVFITMPSAPGGKWGGVAGVQKLIGSKALKELEKEERIRVIEVANKFIKRKGAVITFQKNAWENLRSKNDPVYKIDKARRNKLKGTLNGAPHIPLYGVPPTRLSGPCRDVLKKFLSVKSFPKM